MSVPYDPAAPFAEMAAGRAQVGLVRLRDHVLAEWGGVDAGIYSNRPVRGGTSPSLHRDGRAWDWQQTDRARFDEAVDWLLVHADVLNVQRVTDYLQSRTWITGRGWKPFTGHGAGTLPNWHVERNWAGARDDRPISQIVGPGTPGVTGRDTLMVLAPQKGTPKGRTACVDVDGYHLLCWNGARVKGDVRFGKVRVWKPPTDQPLRSVAARKDGKGVVVLAADGATFDAMWA